MTSFKDFFNYKRLQTGDSSEVEISSSYGFDVISCVKINKKFGNIQAIKDLSVAVPRAIITGVIGANGAGKTTLINLFTGVETPDSGEIIIKGKKYLRVNAKNLDACGIVRTFQSVSQSEACTVEDVLLKSVAKRSLFAPLKKCNNCDEKISEVLEILCLSQYRNKKVKVLSNGQKKLLEFARVLMQNADVYFFDEPFTGLCPEMVNKVCGVISDLQKQGKTIVVIDHNIDVIKRICEYVIVLENGGLLAEGNADNVLRNPYVREIYSTI